MRGLSPLLERLQELWVAKLKQELKDINAPALA